MSARPKINDLVVKVWSCHEAFNRLGFSNDDVFVIPQASGAVYVALRTQGLEFVITAGVTKKTPEAFGEEWLAFVVDLNAHKISEESLQKMWETSEIRQNGVAFVTALLARGFTITGDKSALN